MSAPLPKWFCSRCGTLRPIPDGVDAQALIDNHQAACPLPPPRPAQPAPTVVEVCQKCRHDILGDHESHALVCVAWSPRRLGAA